jgi:hypothetical protein
MKKLAVILLTLLTAPASAQENRVMTGNDLYEACTSEDEAQFGYCVGYIIGLNEGIKFGSFGVVAQATSFEDSAETIQDAANKFLGICAPQEVEYSQIKDLFVDHLRDNPQTRHTSARVLYHRALAVTFPCEEKQDSWSKK